MTAIINKRDQHKQDGSLYNKFTNINNAIVYFNKIALSLIAGDMDKVFRNGKSIKTNNKSYKDKLKIVFNGVFESNNAYLHKIQTVPWSKLFPIVTYITTHLYYKTEN